MTYQEQNEQCLTIVLERAYLETAKVGRNFELLNVDQHKTLLFKHNRKVGDYRPDICHQV